MRTTLNIDDKALANALTFAAGETKTEVVNEALRQFARTKRRKQLLEWRGKVEWEGDIDQLRQRRLFFGACDNRGSLSDRPSIV